MTRTLIVFALLLGFAKSLSAQDQSAKILGIWFNEDKSSQIEIYKTGDSYSGKIVWLSSMENNPSLQPKDKNNPNPELRSRNLVGLDIITGLRYSAGNWTGGRIYAPKRGIYAKCSFEIHGSEQLKVIVSYSGFNKTQTWTRK